MKIFKPGAEVRMKIGPVEGMIIGVCIRSGSVEYELRYMNNGSPSEIWLHDYEIESKVSRSAGFAKTPDLNTDNKIELLIQ